jgi:phosphate uptake regulator
MHTDSIKAVISLDHMLAEDIANRDDDVDRLYFFVVRQLKAAVGDRLLLEELGLRMPQDCLGYRLVAKSLERIADHAVRISSTVSMINEPVPSKLAEAMKEASGIAVNVCENAVKALAREDEALALKAISLANEVSLFEEKLAKMLLQSDIKPRSLAGLRLTLESIRRTAEYGADIAEIALNLTASRLHMRGSG